MKIILDFFKKLILLTGIISIVTFIITLIIIIIPTMVNGAGFYDAFSLIYALIWIGMTIAFTIEYNVNDGKKEEYSQEENKYGLMRMYFWGEQE